ncbi:MAG TPA: DUF2272 domain-containing protein [Stellaceae bacterium]|jgi:hypothetical protein|nr:DUF2272 domain-containing protein [Stellaceae bacterium]
MRIGGAVFLLVCLALAGCGAGPGPVPPARDAQEPPFARVPYQRFSREAAVAIALREWRAFGSPVVSTNQPIAGDPQRERAEGLWQRVGEYWWLGLQMGAPEQGWTGKHDAQGQVFPADQDGRYAWSAAFIDYVMRMAGAADRFPYAPDHASYINKARRHAGNFALDAEPSDSTAPQRGDLICEWRARHPVNFADLPTSAPFPSHCDIVVDARPGTIDAIGGNVDNSVALEQIPVATNGVVADPDPDHHWFVVLRVLYDQ